MEQQKWFVRSKGLWGGAIPLVIAIAGAYGLSTDGLEHQLTDFGNTIMLAVAGGLALWSRFNPDGAKLTVLPGAQK